MLRVGLAGGEMVVEIPDSKGTPHLYTVTRLSAGRWRLAHQQEPDCCYEVRLDGRPWCNCRAFAFGHGEPCKHCRAVEELAQALGLLETQE